MTIKPNLHLAILKCDTINQRIQNKYGDYNVMFPYIFEKAADKELKITWDSFNVVKMIYPDLEDLSRGKYDGIVISGSFASAYENQPWILKLVEFLSYMRTKPFGLNIRLLGVCFGHQILARVCGGVCEKNTNGWELGLYDVKLTPDGKRIFNTDKEFFRIHEVHQDHVILPPGFITLATTSPHTPVQIMISSDNQCISIQGHPEFNRDTTLMLLNEIKDLGAVSEVLGDNYIKEFSSSGPDTDAIWMTRQFIKFFKGKLVL